MPFMTLKGVCLDNEESIDFSLGFRDTAKMSQM